MPDSNLFKKTVVKVQERSGFDKSFRNLLTTKCGTLTPLLCDEVIPNTTVNLKLAINATLPPLASETFMNVNLKVEAFFCPHRLLMRGFEEFAQGRDQIQVGTSPQSAQGAYIRVPRILCNSGGANLFGPGSLADYLGFRSTPTADATYLNFLPFLCYHTIWNEWYRNSQIQKDIFEGEDFVNTSTQWAPVRMKRIIPNSVSGFTTNGSQTFLDGVRVTSLRQRNFDSDYFTTALPSPQAGPAQKITMVLPDSTIRSSDWNTTPEWEVTDGSNNEWNLGVINTDYNNIGNADIEIKNASFGLASSPSVPSFVEFSISSLRACNSLQQWLERNSLCGRRWVDYLKAQYNANLKDSIAQRPVYLGSASFPVYSKGIYQTSKDTNTGNNPFNSVGSRYGHAYAEGSSYIIDHYTAEEPGYIMVLCSLVPEVTYSSGINKYLTRYLDQSSYGELANPILQNVGMEPIRVYEFDKYYNDDDSFGVFGYTDRFASWMTRNHELHGLLRDGQTLDSFALQRSGTAEGISSAFLEIPTNYMDQVTAVDNSISNYGAWIDSYLDYKVTMPLSRYCIPSLQDPAYEHGDTVVISRGGRSIQ